MSDNETKVNSTKTSNTKKTTNSTTKKKPNTQQKKTASSGTKKPAAKSNQGAKKTTSTAKKPATGAKKPAPKKSGTNASGTKKSSTAKKPVNKTGQTKKAVASKPIENPGIDAKQLNSVKKPTPKKKTNATKQTTQKNTVKKPVVKKDVTVKSDDKVVKNVKQNEKFTFKDEKTGEPIAKTVAKNQELNKKKPPVIKKAKKVKKTKKRRMNGWLITILLMMIVGISFLAYVFIASSNNGPVYGDRCASSIAIEQTIIDEFIDEHIENEMIESLSLSVECLTLKLSITFVDDTTSKDGKTLAKELIEKFDNAIGLEKEEDQKYSEIFSTFDVEFILQSTGDSDYPMFGTKHKNNDSFSFTGSNPANEETTNSLIEEEIEEEVEEDE